MEVIVEEKFWLQKWEKNEIAFHESEANPYLVKHFKELSLKKGARVFLPLCGKTNDIGWLLSKGYRVVGAELSALAIEQLFKQLGLNPKISVNGKLNHYQENNIDIFVGNIFELSKNMIGPVDAIYDRAALVALPGVMRNKYSLHLMEITHKAPQLLICYQYDQSLAEGPPFSISDEEVNRHYSGSYDLLLLESMDVAGGLRGKYPAKERVWLLKNGRRFPSA